MPAFQLALSGTLGQLANPGFEVPLALQPWGFLSPPDSSYWSRGRREGGLICIARLDSFSQAGRPASPPLQMTTGPSENGQKPSSTPRVPFATTGAEGSLQWSRRACITSTAR